MKVIYKWADGEQKLPVVYGDPLDSYFTLHSIQFRWGSDLNSGSEHHITGRRYYLLNQRYPSRKNELT